MRRRHYTWPLIAVAIISLALAACSLDPAGAGSGNAAARSATTATPAASATASARTIACRGLTTINGTLATLLSANVNTTVGQVKSVQQKVTNTLNAVESRVPSSSEGLVGQIRSANDQLGAKLEGYPDTTPIGQTSDTVQNIKTNVASAQAKTTLLALALKCLLPATPMPTP